ncbi:MAG: hypothetical protein ACK4HQ_03315 [Brevinematales bacterium]
MDKEFSIIVKDLLVKGQPFSLKFYVINEDIETKVETALHTVFEFYNRQEYTGVIYTCVKELMINATKANLKRVLFEMNHLDIHNENHYLEGMLAFRNLLAEKSYHTFLPHLKEKNFWVTIRLNHSSDGVKIEVINNACMAPIENRRLREKLKKAMQYENLAEFYLEQGDEMEGAGMGIALIVMLLKGMELDPALFRIGTTLDDQTFARIEVPFTLHYKHARE